MTNLLKESFDDNLWGLRLGGTLTSTEVHTDNGIHGKGAKVGDTVDKYFTVPVPSTAKFTIGFAFKVVTPGGTDRTFVVFDTSTTLKFDSNRVHLHCTGGVTADIDWYSDVASTPEDEWAYLEIQLEHGASSDGTLKWWLNGDLLDETTVHDYASTLAASATFGPTGTSDIDEVHFDDLYVNDALGGVDDGPWSPVQIGKSLPNGNGNSSVLVGSDADSTDNYLLVDNNAAAPPATTEYVGSATEGDKDVYAMEDLAGTPTVVSLTVSLYAQKTDTGTKYVRPVVRSGTTDYAGTSVALAEAWGLVEQSYAVDPDTAVAWLYGGVNSVQVGPEVRDS